MSPSVLVRRNRNGMTDNKDDKTLGVKKTLTLKPSGVSQGTVRQDMDPPGRRQACVHGTSTSAGRTRRSTGSRSDTRACCCCASGRPRTGSSGPTTAAAGPGTGRACPTACAARPAPGTAGPASCAPRPASILLWPAASRHPEPASRAIGTAAAPAGAPTRRRAARSLGQRNGCASSRPRGGAGS